jgi:hypothetical protein
MTTRDPLVTGHGQSAARTLPISRSPARLAKLVAEGKVRPARPGPRPTPTPRATQGTVSDLVAEQQRRPREVSSPVRRRRVGRDARRRGPNQTPMS